MKKVVVFLLFLVVLASFSFAQVFIGSRQAGMGGTGVASAVGLNAVAYNPAGLLRGPSGELLISLGSAQQGIDQLSQMASKASDPAQFMIDNYSTKLDANGTISGIIGFNAANTGLSVLIPPVAATLSKPANSLEGSVLALGTPAAVLTLGQSFSIPGIPMGTLDTGINIKYVVLGYGALTIGGEPTSTTPVTATQTVYQGSGLGYDVGLRTTFEIPYITEFSVGVATQDLSETLKYKPKTRTDTYTLEAGSTTPKLQKGTEVESAEVSVTAPTSTLIGCSGTIPGIGLKFAADVESVSGGSGILAVTSDTITHLGIEYPLYMGALILRAGSASGQNTSVTTWGAKINIPVLTLEMANIVDNKNSKNTSYVVDVGLAF